MTIDQLMDELSSMRETFGGEHPVFVQIRGQVRKIDEISFFDVDYDYPEEPAAAVIIGDF